MNDDQLQNLIMKSSPAAFWREIPTRQEALYNEARSYSYNKELWEDTEAETVFPIALRAIFENVVRRAAKLTQLKHFNMMHNGENYPYVLVKSGKLVITAHHVAGPNHFVRSAESRKQHAGVNEWLDT